LESPPFFDVSLGTTIDPQARLTRLAIRFFFFFFVATSSKSA